MGRRIRADLVGQLVGHRRDEHGRPMRSRPVYLSAGDEVPETVLVSERHLAPADEETGPGAGAGDGGRGAGEGAPPTGQDIGAPPVDVFDPDEFTVDEVNTKLEDQPLELVRVVIEREVAGRGRHGITNGPAAKRLPHSD